MSVHGRWFVTPHATTRFSEYTGLSFDESRKELIRISLIAKRVKRLRTGATLYVLALVGVGKLRFIVNAGHGQLPALVTVKREHDGQYGDRR